MNAHFRTLVGDVASTEAAFKAAQRRLDDARKACQHTWDDPKGKYTPIRTEGYRTQNLMGHFTVNHDGSVNAPEVWIPAKETPEWTRTCTTCGHSETTTQTDEKVVRTSTPKFK